MPVLVKKEKEKEDSDKEEDGFGILRIEGHHREVPPHSTEANPPTPGGPRRDPMNEGPYHGLERQMSKEISLHFQDIQELEHARDLCHARELNHAREQEHARERARVQPVDVEDCPLSMFLNVFIDTADDKNKKMFKYLYNSNRRILKDNIIDSAFVSSIRNNIQM